MAINICVTVGPVSATEDMTSEQATLVFGLYAQSKGWAASVDWAAMTTEEKQAFLDFIAAWMRYEVARAAHARTVASGGATGTDQASSDFYDVAADLMVAP